MPPKSQKRSSSKQGGDASSKKAKALPTSKRFPLHKINEMLEQKFTKGTVKSEAALFLTAILEYLSVEILELSANNARSTNSDADKGKISLQNIQNAIEADAEIKQLMDKVRGKK